MDGHEQMCAFFEADSTFAENGVSSDGHDAESGLSFFVPVAGTPHAVRVPICQRHSRQLEEIYSAPTAPGESPTARRSVPSP
jgi:hypothetical protein